MVPHDRFDHRRTESALVARGRRSRNRGAAWSSGDGSRAEERAVGAGELAPIVQANPTLTAAFVVATGMIGAMIGPSLMSAAGVHDPVARGLALGTISHGQGAAQAVVEGEVQGAAAGIAMGLAAVFTSLVAPILVPMLR